ncbi:MAG: sugar lactone lactonase YvrE, partial [Reinekea sp.]
MNQDISVLAELNMTLGESPRWNSQEKSWYWVDIIEGLLYRYCTQSEILSHRRFPFKTAVFFFTEKNHIILTSSKGLYLLESFDGDEIFLGNPETNVPDNRFNDGVSTPEGGFIAGTIGDGSQPNGSTYQFELINGVLNSTLLRDKYTIINGQVFSPNGEWYYATDTPTQEILKYPYDRNQQSLGEPHLFYSFKNTNEFPDGAAVDHAGNYWIALYGSGKVCQISPEGKRLQDIDLPVSQPTMLAFGGPSLSQLLVT